MTRIPLTVLILALAGAFFLLGLSAPPSHAAGPREVLHDWHAKLIAKPGKVAKIAKRGPRHFAVDRMVLKIGGKFAPVADYRGCAVDAARAGVILTLNACAKSGRITLRTATTGRKRVRVFVRLTQFRPKPQAPTRGDGTPAEPTPPPSSGPCTDPYADPDAPASEAVDTDCDGQPDYDDVCPALADDGDDSDDDGIGDACEAKP